MKDYYPEGMLINLPENRKIILSKEKLAAARASEKILESTVIMCDTGHNLFVELGGIKGVIPRGEGAIGIAEGTTRDIALISRVGKPVSFTVTGFETDEYGRPYALLSRKKAQESGAATRRFCLLTIFPFQEYLTRKTVFVWATR